MISAVADLLFFVTAATLPEIVSADAELTHETAVAAAKARRKKFLFFIGMALQLKGWKIHGSIFLQ